MRILITGSRGQLGTDCAKVLSGHELALRDLPQIDIASDESVAREFDAFKPQVVVNCAAWTAVDAAESAEADAYRANCTGPATLAAHCAKNGALLVHVSTDYVLPGDLPVPQAADETAAPAPRSAYGRTKLAGERAILDSGCECVILRTAWLYGAHGRNFPKTMLRLALAKPGDTARVVADQWGCPTWSLQLARQIAAVIALDPQKRPRGVCHAVSQGHANWAEFADEFLSLMGVAHKITPCTTAEYPTPAVRPANSILDDRRLREAGVLVMDDWRAALQDFVKENREALLAEAAQSAAEAALGHTFRDRTLLATALTHPSWVCEHPGDGVESNQRLEFLGDAVVGLCLAENLYGRFPQAPEGALTRMRSSLASGEALAAKASALGLGRFMRFGRGEKENGGAGNPHNLADAMEAVLGAIWLDGGAEAAFAAFQRIFGADLAAVSPPPPGGESPKSELQVVAAKRGETPVYAIIDRRGPDSDTVFTAEVSVGALSARGEGRSKRLAETAAATALLEKLPRD
ncbi:MAG: dTDP-4-dehydrorhamnose reductase [Kiritimatiellae bacterium]|nr:dTDP-4-dehydrorhamnose reductase [Kiritimatiellia bacterium]